MESFSQCLLLLFVSLLFIWRLASHVPGFPHHTHLFFAEIWKRPLMSYAYQVLAICCGILQFLRIVWRIRSHANCNHHPDSPGPMVLISTTLLAHRTLRPVRASGNPDCLVPWSVCDKMSRQITDNHQTKNKTAVNKKPSQTKPKPRNPKPTKWYYYHRRGT